MDATGRRPLEVVLPLWTFVPGGMGGSETYVRGLLGAWSHADVRLTTLVTAVGAGALPGEQREVVGGRGAGGASTPQRLLTLARATRPDRATRRALAAADVVHHPFTVPRPTERGARGVVSLLDVQHRDLPELFSRAELAYRSVLYDRAARRADHVITISAFSRDRIVETLGVPRERVSVAHLGVDPTEFDDAGGEREPFVFYPARAWPHKNHARLLRAMDLVRRRRPGLRLVLTGGDPGALGALPEWAEHRGQLPFGELRRLYATASCLAFPSLYEGFGLPPLEAMASGCPVAAADSGSVAEVCGDAAVLFDPLDPQAIAAGIEQALGGRDHLVAAGREQVRRFTWAACADVHAEVYRRVAAPAR